MPFSPGVSGNPGGRPKAARNIQALARAHSEAALAVVIEIMRDPAVPATTRLAAADKLLERGWGRPTQFSPIDLEELGDLLGAAG